MNIIIIIISIVIIFTGLILNILTLIGTPLMFLSCLGLSYINNFSDLNFFILTSLFIITVLVEVLDFFSGAVGVKLSGAGKATTKFCFAGIIAGTILSIFTFQFYLIFLGLIIGTLIGQLLEKEKFNFIKFLKIIISIALSKFIVYILKISVSIVMFILFIYQNIQYFS